MSESDPVLALLDDLLEIVEGTQATAIDVTADGFSVRLRRVPTAPAAAANAGGAVRAAAQIASEVFHVRSPAVGIFSSAKEWKVGDGVAQGELLGNVQSLGHVAEIVASGAGIVREVLTPSGAPVEYGQALLAVGRA